MLIGQYSSQYGLIMAGSVLSLIPVLIVFICIAEILFVEGIASTGFKGLRPKVCNKAVTQKEIVCVTALFYSTGITCWINIT